MMSLMMMAMSSHRLAACWLGAPNEAHTRQLTWKSASSEAPERSPADGRASLID